MDVPSDPRAKDLFLKYGGSHFHMEREGEYQEYKRYKISKEQEQKWIQDYQKNLLIQVENNEIIDHKFHNLCTSIIQYKSIDCLKELAELANKKKQLSDTFSILLMAEGILDIVEYFKKNGLGNNQNTIFAKITSLNLLKWLLERPVTVSDRYLEKDYLIDFSDQKIIDRIYGELKKWI